MKRKWLLLDYHPIVRTLLMGTVFINMARAMSMTFLAIYLATNTTMNPALIGSVIGAGAVAGTVGGWMGGTISDWIGRRKVVIGSLLAIGLVFEGYPFASSTFVYFLLSIAGGLSSSFLGPVVKALLGDLTEPDKRVRVFSMQYMAVNVGYVVGPLLGSLLGLSGGIWSFVAAGSVFLLYALLLQILLVAFGIQELEGQQAKERIPVLQAWRVIRADKALRFLLIGGMLSLTVHGQMSVTLSQYVINTFEGASLLFSTLLSVNAVMVILFQVPLSKWFEKRTPFFNIIVGSLLFTIGEIGFAFAQNWALMILAMVVITIGEILVVPAEYQMIDHITPEGMRGTYYGAQNFMTFGNFLGPWLGGLIMSTFSGRAMFVMYGAIALVSILFYGLGQKKRVDRRLSQGSSAA